MLIEPFKPLNVIKPHNLNISFSLKLQNLFKRALFLICTSLVLQFSLGCAIQTAQSEVHLVPKGFVGQVTLYFNELNGASPQWERGSRLYEIPANGQLRTQFAPNEGIRPIGITRFYYVDPSGKRTRIASLTTQNLAPDTIVISNLYVIGKELHYFVDTLDRINNHKPPAINDAERKWQ